MTTESEALVLADAAYTAVTGVSATGFELTAILQVAYIESEYGDFWIDRAQPNVNNIGNLIANADWLATNPSAFIDWQTGLRIYVDGLVGLYTAKFRTYASPALGWQDFIRALLTWSEWPGIRASSTPFRITAKSGTPNFTAEQQYYFYKYP